MAKPGVIIQSNRLGELAAKFPERAAAVVGDTADDTATTIRERITAVGAVRSGHMRDTTEAMHAPGSHTADVVTQADYWEHVNYGTEDADGNTRMAARPFVEPSADVMQTRLDDRTLGALRP